MSLDALRDKVMELEGQLRAEDNGEHIESESLKALEDPLLTSHPELRCRLLMTLSSSYQRRGLPLEASPYSSEALALAETIDDPLLYANALRSKGNIHLYLAEHDVALEHLTKAQDLYVQLGDIERQAYVCGSIGNVHWQLADYPRALEFFMKALSDFERLGDKRSVSRARSNVGVVYMDMSDYPRALEFFMQSLDESTALNDSVGIAQACSSIGLLYSTLSNYSMALDYLLRAKVASENSGDKLATARNEANIGNVYSGLLDHAKAIEYYKNAFSTFEELGNRRDATIAIGNIGNTYLTIANYSEALEYLQQALVPHVENGERADAVRVRTNIGVVYQNLQKYPQALECFLSALSESTEIGYTQMIATCTQSLGLLYAEPTFESHDFSRAEEYLQKALELNERMGTKHNLYQCHGALASLYETQERWRECTVHLKAFHELKDKVHNEEAKNKAQQYEVQQQLLVREKAVAVERALQETRIVEQQRLLHRILPPQVADRLLRGERVADYFQHISIMFIDIVGFTPIAARMPAKAVLAFLNFVFGEFDKIMEKHNCQKIKTIGDGYMAVSGAPIACDDHAERLASAGLELMTGIELPEAIRKTLPKDSVFHLRIGLHTGSAFAGIVGEKGFVYDVYSDAVNLAARMESSGEPGKIHCSEDFAYHLQNRDESFVFEERGEIEVKGKGVMRTFFLETAV